jgi:uncharacterized protein YdaU (DUF1376 family)
MFFHSDDDQRCKVNMSSKVDIWMPLYVADYLSATSRLTTEQHGAYLLLLMDYWKNGPPPDNDGVLAQITRLSPSAWSDARTMLEAFFEVQSGQWSHHRVEQELAKANHNKEVNSRRGKAGADARYGKKDAPTMLQASLMHSTSPSPSPSPIPTSTTNTNICPPAGGPALPDCNHQGVIDLYHQQLPTLRRVEVWNAARQGYLRQRWREVAAELGKDKPISASAVLDWFNDFFGHIQKSRFLIGKVNSKDGRSFTADLEWILKPSNFAKIVEGKYHGTN